MILATLISILMAYFAFRPKRKKAVVVKQKQKQKQKINRKSDTVYHVKFDSNAYKVMVSGENKGSWYKCKWDMVFYFNGIEVFMYDYKDSDCLRVRSDDDRTSELFIKKHGLKVVAKY